jgi:hypothetical protein
VLTFLDASDELVAHVQEHHPVGKEGCLNCIGQEDEAVVDEVAPKKDRPRGHLRLLKGINEGDYGG